MIPTAPRSIMASLATHVCHLTGKLTKTLKRGCGCPIAPATSRCRLLRRPLLAVCGFFATATEMEVSGAEQTSKPARFPRRVTAPSAESAVSLQGFAPCKADRLTTSPCSVLCHGARCRLTKAVIGVPLEERPRSAICNASYITVLLLWCPAISPCGPRAHGSGANRR